MKTKLLGKLGAAVLVTIGLAIIPNRTIADICTFDFQGTLGPTIYGQAVNGLSLADENGTFFDVIYTFNSAAPVPPTFPPGPQLKDPSGTSSMILSNSFGATSLIGINGVNLTGSSQVLGGAITLYAFGTDTASGAEIRMLIRAPNTGSIPDDFPASAIQLLESNPAADNRFGITFSYGFPIYGSASSVSYSIQPVPEPSAAAIFGMGMLGIVAALRRRAIIGWHAG